MEYIEVKDSIVVGHYCGEMPKKSDGIKRIEIDNPIVNIGEDIRFYSNLIKGIKKPLRQLLEENLETIPIGKKLNSDGTGFEDMTEAEKWDAGLITLEPNQWLDDDSDYIREKTPEEKFEFGLINKNEYNIYIDRLRQLAYSNEADPLFFEYQRGEKEKQAWLDKIAEIKNRYPKAAEVKK